MSERIEWIQKSVQCKVAEAVEVTMKCKDKEEARDLLKSLKRYENVEKNIGQAFSLE